MMERIQENLLRKRPGYPAKLSVLVIDDDADLLELQKIILEGENFGVFTAQHAQEAFEILEKNAAPDLILLDVHMAGMSGPEFLTMLEEKRPDIVASVPIVFLSGVDEIPESKAAGYIRKGLDMHDYLKAIRSFINKGGHKPPNHRQWREGEV